MWSRAAARPKWSSSATATKYRSRRRSTGEQYRTGHDRGRERSWTSPGRQSDPGTVKALWFHLMPYPQLPDGFREKYRGVWVDLDPKLLDAGVVADAYDEYLDQLVFAEEAGFDGVCVNEHHGNGYGLMPSPNLMASILARRTSRAAVVVLGNSVALYNPPIRVAEEFAMLDCISGGRLDAAAGGDDGGGQLGGRGAHCPATASLGTCGSRRAVATVSSPRTRPSSGLIHHRSSPSWSGHMLRSLGITCSANSFVE